MSARDSKRYGVILTDNPMPVLPPLPEGETPPMSHAAPPRPRPRKQSMRANAPRSIALSDSNHNRLGPPKKMAGDFPSPGSAPKNTRIFDANAVAESKGVETAEPGWATDGRSQGRLEEMERVRVARENGEEIESTLQRSFSTMKRAVSVKRAKSIKRALSVKRSGTTRRPNEDSVPDMPTSSAVELMDNPKMDGMVIERTKTDSSGRSY